MKPGEHINNHAAWLQTTIESFIRTSPENSLKNKENEKAWADPLVGFSSGNDPLYQFYKEDIGDFYWTPSDIFGKTFPFFGLQTGSINGNSMGFTANRGDKVEQQKTNSLPFRKLGPGTHLR